MRWGIYFRDLTALVEAGVQCQRHRVQGALPPPPPPQVVGLLRGDTGTLPERVLLWGSTPRRPGMRAGPCGGGGQRGAMRQFLKQKKLKYEALIELSMDMNNAVRAPGSAPI